MNSPLKPSDVKAAQTAEAVIGHNNPPPYDADEMARIEAEVAQWADAAGDWLDLKEIETEEQAQYLTDFIAGARKKFKEVDDKRKAAKKPHDEAAKAVQTAFRTPLAVVERSTKKAKDLIAPYLRKKEQAEAERRRAAEAEARRQQEEADRLQREAEARNDVAGQVAAEEAAAAAEKAAKEAARVQKSNVKSATGGGRTISLRKQKFAEATDLNALFLHYRRHPKVRELLETLATADLRSASVDDATIPGITIYEKESAA